MTSPEPGRPDTRGGTGAPGDAPGGVDASEAAEDAAVTLAAPEGFALPDLGGVVAGARAVRGATSDIDTVHLDTPDRALARVGLALHHRRRGARETWTLTSPAAPAQEVPGPADRPPTALVAGLGSAAGELRRAARLSTTRRRTAVTGTDGAPLATVDDEQVSVFEGGRVARRVRRIGVTAVASAPSGTLAAVVARLVDAGATLGAAPDDVSLARASAEATARLIAASGASGDAAAVERTDAASGPASTPGLASAGGDVPAEDRRAGERRGDDRSAGAGSSAPAGPAGPAEVLGSALASAVGALLRAALAPDEDAAAFVARRSAAGRLRSLLTGFERLLDTARTTPLVRELEELDRLLAPVTTIDAAAGHVEAALADPLLADLASGPSLRRLVVTERDRVVGRYRKARADHRFGALLDSAVRLAVDPPIDPAALRRGTDAVTAVVRDRWSGLRRRGRRVEVAPAGADAAAVAGDVGVLLVIAEAAVGLVDDAGRAADRTRRALASLDEALAATATATWLARATRDARPEVAFGAGVVAARQRQAGRAVGETWSDRWAAVSKRSTWRWAR